MCPCCLITHRHSPCVAPTPLHVSSLHHRLSAWESWDDFHSSLLHSSLNLMNMSALTYTHNSRFWHYSHAWYTERCTLMYCLVRAKEIHEFIHVSKYGNHNNLFKWRHEQSRALNIIIYFVPSPLDKNSWYIAWKDTENNRQRLITYLRCIAWPASFCIPPMDFRFMRTQEIFRRVCRGWTGTLLLGQTGELLQSENN